MPQTIAIILKIGEGNNESFEQLFEREILLLWHEFVSEATSSTSRCRGMAEHAAFDRDPRFLDFLSRAKKLQSEEPFVWFGTTLHQVP